MLPLDAELLQPPAEGAAVRRHRPVLSSSPGISQGWNLPGLKYPLQTVRRRPAPASSSPALQVVAARLVVQCPELGRSVACGGGGTHHGTHVCDHRSVSARAGQVSETSIRPTRSAPPSEHMTDRSALASPTCHALLPVSHAQQGRRRGWGHGAWVGPHQRECGRRWELRA